MKETSKYDVIVVGGGTAGLFAAISSANAGAKTLLIEQKDYLGGLLTAGMGIGGVFDIKGTQVISGAIPELIRRISDTKGGCGIVKIDNQDRWIPSVISIDPEWMKQIAFDMVQESGCQLLLRTAFMDSTTENNYVKGINVIYAGQKISLFGDVIIDATGNADVAASAGAETMIGDEHGEHQSQSCVIRISNVNTDEFVAYMNNTINTNDRAEWTIEEAACRGGGDGYWLPWKDASGVHLPNTCGIYYHGNKGDIFINATHIEIDPLDPFAVAAALVELRKQANDICAFLKSKVPGFKDAYLSNVYEFGIRDSRRVVGEYIMTLQDLEKNRHFEDVVCRGAYPPDIHKNYGDVKINTTGCFNYEIPYRAIISKDFDNLLMAGRCISATFEAASGIRGMGPCIATGQAAGVAAALAVSNKDTPKKLNTQQVQQALRLQGVIL
ncbi:MAG TPA: FAD-dependent oxidoreductase [Bacillota bacterium]